jgi:ribosomal protein S18 acetylase RimI-like enzyme
MAVPTPKRLEGKQLLVTLAESNELDEILNIDKEVIGNDYRKEFIIKSVEEKKCLVARLPESSIVGFLIYNTNFFACSFISLVIVHPLERNKGYGKFLLKYFEEISPTDKIFTSTNESNEEMQKLLSSIGYVKSGWIENLDEDDPEIIYFKEKNNAQIKF